MKPVVLGLAALLVILPTAVLAHGHSNDNQRHYSHNQRHERTSPQKPTTPIPPPQTPPTVPPASTGEIRFDAYITGYASGDNDPAGSTGTYIDGVEGNAGGTGTYSNPITMASGYVGDKADFPRGTMFYVPNLQRYFVAGDTCAECHKGNSGLKWIDLYAGDYSGSNVLNCEDSFTGNFLVIEDPKSTYKVTNGSLYTGSVCTKQYGDGIISG